MQADYTFVVLVLAFAVGVALLLAQLRLFSIDRTLKEILEELRARQPSNKEERPLEGLKL